MQTRRKLHLTTILGLALLTPAAHAFGSNAMLARMDAQLTSRFAQADVNHDGLLTREEAQAGMPLVAQHFDEIDTEHKGAATLAQLRAYMKTEMAKRSVVHSTISQGQP